MADDFSALEKMAYSGRGIILGMTTEGKPFLAYTLTGRSPSSQARRLVVKDRMEVWTEPTDPKVLETGNKALLIYPAIIPTHRSMVVSNGAQTPFAFRGAMAYESSDSINPAMMALVEALAPPHLVEGIDVTTYEPDSPNYTPRITGCIIRKDAAFNIVSRGPDGKSASRMIPFMLSPGRGRLITTYKGGNEKPLLPFEGDPLNVSIESKLPDDILESVYASLKGSSAEDYRVAAAVMLMDPGKEIVLRIKNRCDL